MPRRAMRRYPLIIFGLALSKCISVWPEVARVIPDCGRSCGATVVAPLDSLTVPHLEWLCPKALSPLERRATNLSRLRRSIRVYDGYRLIIGPVRVVSPEVRVPGKLSAPSASRLAVRASTGIESTSRIGVRADQIGSRIVHPVVDDCAVHRPKHWNSGRASHFGRANRMEETIHSIA